jgi:hypothetical protein
MNCSKCGSLMENYTTGFSCKNCGTLVSGTYYSGIPTTLIFHQRTRQEVEAEIVHKTKKFIEENKLLFEELSRL